MSHEKHTAGQGAIDGAGGSLSGFGDWVWGLSRLDRSGCSSLLEQFYQGLKVLTKPLCGQ